MKNIIVKNTDEVINVEDGEQAFIFDFIATDEVKTSLQINIGKNCSIEYVSVLNKARVTNIEAGDNSQIKMSCLYLKEGQFVITTTLNDNCVLTSQVLLWQKDEQAIEVKDSCIFHGQGSYGRFSVKALADDKAIVNYLSEVKIERQAVLSDARIEMDLALLSPEAKGVMLPGLKVENSQVKAGHGASTFQISPEDLFYLNARGLELSEIKTLITYSAVKNFTDGIQDEKSRLSIHELLTV